MKDLKQKLFDVALNHIREQGRPSIDKCGECVYQGEDGKSCAFAPAIKTYRKAMEFNSASTLLVNFSEDLVEWVRPIDLDFANKIQLCHDDHANYNSDDDKFLADFESSMESLAEKEGLDYEKPESV